MKTRAFMAAGCVAGVIAAVPVSPAFAAAGGTGHTVTETLHQHGTWTETGDTDFCTGEEVTPTITGNMVQHVTFFPGGDEVWGTFTEEGTVVADIRGLTYTGRITVWGNFNVNEKNANNTFTSSANLSAVDENGVVHVEVGHEVAHVSWNAVDQAPTVSFDKMSFTCS
ncbi:MAG TPA: hypothetical protein VN738_04955 [Acidothermaceae bacterium]|nr:hypothetical protein [Acidothermaceae bacterium]